LKKKGVGGKKIIMAFTLLSFNQLRNNMQQSSGNQNKAKVHTLHFRGRACRKVEKKKENKAERTLPGACAAG